MCFTGIIQWITNNAELITAACAVSVSVISLFVASKALSVQRKHNRLSVRPIAHFSRGDYEDCIFVKLKNNGLGPMLIINFSATNISGTHSSLIEALEPHAKAVTWDTFTDRINGKVLAPNQEFVLIKVSFNSADTIKATLRKILSETTIRVTYKNVYEEEQAPLEEKLLWFAR